MPHWLGLRDLQVFLGHRERLPIDVVAGGRHDGHPADHGPRPAVDRRRPARRRFDRRADRGGHGAVRRRARERCPLSRRRRARRVLPLAGHMAGLQVGVHAIGDRAIEQVITVWERVYAALDSRERRHFRARRHRIEHFEMASAAQVERAAMLGLAVSVQPAFDRCWGAPGGLYDTGLGWERAAAMNPFRTMIDRGIEVGAGSDTRSRRSTRCCRSRRAKRITMRRNDCRRVEAIRLHTSGGARSGIRKTRRARSVRACTRTWWCSTPIRCPWSSVEGLRPILTVSLGREVSRALNDGLRWTSRRKPLTDRSRAPSSVCHSLSAGRIDGPRPTCRTFRLASPPRRRRTVGPKRLSRERGAPASRPQRSLGSLPISAPPRTFP